MGNPTSEQVPIISHDDGHAMVSAAPGSGKTTTMTDYVVNAIGSGSLAPSRLLVMMFNTSTAKDFRSKLSEKGLSDSGALSVYTYHAMALRLCKLFQQKGIISSFEFEPNEGKLRYEAIGSLTRAFGQKEFFKNKQEIVDTFLSFVDFKKSGFLTPGEVFDHIGINKDFLPIIDAYEDFEDRRNKQNRLYFSDLLTRVVSVLSDSEAARNLVSNKKDRIIVDEFQDTNPIQYEMLKLLAGDQGSLMVVGDIDQSIYDWRGADPNIMLHQVHKDFPDITLYPLSKTFRYGGVLSQASKDLISNNKNRFDQFCESFDPAQPFALSFFTASSSYEPELVLNRIQNRLDRGFATSDIAVLTRTYGAAGGIEMELLRAGIAPIIPKESSVLVSREMNLIISIALICNQFSEKSKDKSVLRQQWADAISNQSDSFRVLLDYSPITFIGAESKNSVISAFVNQQEPPSRFILNDPLVGAIKKSGEFKYRKVKDVFFDLESVVSKLHSMSFSEAVSAFMDRLESDSFLAGRNTTTVDVDTSKRRISAIKKFIRHHKMGSGDFFMAIDRLISERDNAESRGDGIFILSIHKAKGLEWDCIIMPSLENNLFPFKPEGKRLSSDLVESERRLFYVGMTRAKSELDLIAPDNDPSLLPFMKGQGQAPGITSSKVSPFVYETKINSLVSKGFADFIPSK